MGEVWKPDVVVSMVVCRFWEFKEVQLNYTKMGQEFVCASSPTWLPPLSGFVKYNIDANFQLHSTLGGGGVVFRDSNGTILYTVMFKQFLCSSALVAEAISFHHAIYWARSLGYQHVCFESDAKLVVNALAEGSSCPTKITSVVFTINRELQAFSRTLLSRVQRSGNRVAHALAQLSREPLDFDRVFETFPPLIAALALGDAVGFHV
ncbi:uncharacterized protein LOC132276070 [Cornus florida]|uniref:uncharacterized protein LOC132276070 n=1 Tax=Cornus florida TaxID=4283 RepID=UPI00289E4B4A|nr:uncharacterized protein LOC132276070 [Cornus florida]